jgi:hypothetical protein
MYSYNYLLTGNKAALVVTSCQASSYYPHPLILHLAKGNTGYNIRDKLKTIHGAKKESEITLLVKNMIFTVVVVQIHTNGENHRAKK